MQNPYGYLYEQELRTNFERQIYAGHLTASTIQEMVDNNQIAEEQIVVAEGLFGRTFDRAKGLLGSRKEDKGFDRDYERERLKGQSALKRHRAVLSRALDDYLNDLRILNIATPEIEASIRNMKNEIDRHVMSARTGGDLSFTGSASREPLARDVQGQWAKGRKGRFVSRQGTVNPPR